MNREIKANQIINVVEDLCVEANTLLRSDVLDGLKELYEKDSQASKKMIKILLENAEIARKNDLAICQDTGMVTVFIEMGKCICIPDKVITDVVNKGVEKAYKEHFFRKSVVADPLLRDNTGTNTPAVIHIDITDGDKLKISVMPKGFGSENKSRMAMLNPTSTVEEIINFCIESVKLAGADACPPYVLGIGIGGTAEVCVLNAKKVLLRPINEANPKRHIAELENRIKKETNKLGIGVMGLGGLTTVMGVNIREAPTHIAGLPVAVNISCHALRSASAEI